MKNFNRLRSIIFTAIMVFSFTAIESKTIGRFYLVIGKVQVNNGNGWKRARRGMLVTDTSKVQTSVRSTAMIAFANGSRVKVRHTTFISMAGFASGKYGTATNVNLKMGGITAYISKAKGGKRNRFRVRTPTAVAGVRGTIEEVTYSPDFGTQVNLLESTAEVINAVGKRVVVPQGATAETTRNGKMVKPYQAMTRKTRVRKVMLGMSGKERRSQFRAGGSRMRNPSDWRSLIRNTERKRFDPTKFVQERLRINKL